MAFYLVPLASIPLLLLHGGFYLQLKERRSRIVWLDQADMEDVDGGLTG